jgi:retron-type reverse transcriptase
LLTVSLNRAFAIDNLNRAWQWTRTNPDAEYKNYFRHIYKAYSLAADEKIEDLHKRLKNETYKALHATKIYLPKKSGILRPYTLLSIEDQILYQALANIVAEKLYPKVKGGYLSTVFGHLYAGKRSLFFYKKWQECYKAYAQSLEDAYDAGYEYAASFDLTACYDSIDHSVLSHFLGDVGLEKEFIAYFCQKLKHWSASSHEKPIYQGHGIPQGPQPSGIVSECVLRYFDQHMKNHRKTKYFRYVDDIRLLAKSEPDLRRLLIDLDMVSKSIGLFPQTSKIDIHKIQNIHDEIKNISNPPEVVVRQEEPDQKKVFERIVELSRISHNLRF